MIIDEQIVMTGSFNYSTNATESNDENVAIIHNADVARMYVQEFERQWAISHDPEGGQCLYESDDD